MSTEPRQTLQPDNQSDGKKSCRHDEQRREQSWVGGPGNQTKDGERHREHDESTDDPPDPGAGRRPGTAITPQTRRARAGDRPFLSRRVIRTLFRHHSRIADRKRKHQAGWSSPGLMDTLIYPSIQGRVQLGDNNVTGPHQSPSAARRSSFRLILDSLSVESLCGGHFSQSCARSTGINVVSTTTGFDRLGSPCGAPAGSRAP